MTVHCRSGVVHPGWVFQPVHPKSQGYLVTIGPCNSSHPDPKPKVHITSGNGLTNCGIDTQAERRGHRTYGLQYVVMASMPTFAEHGPRKGQRFVLCTKC